MADKVLVTGISGFLGGHVALALLDAGYAVRGSLRDSGKAPAVRAALKAASASGNVERLELIGLDLRLDDGWAKAAEGCRYVQHVASPLVLRMPKDRQELIGPAVEGTRRALRAGLAAGVERIVLTSSVAAIVYGHPATRTAPFTGADWSNTEGEGVTAYTESKTRAELEAWSIMEGAGRRGDLAVVNPSVILGPLLYPDPRTSGMMVLRLLDGSTPAAPKMHLGVVDVRDVAELHLKAMETPAAGGQRYIASAGALSFMEAANALRAAFPERAHRIPRWELPDWVVRLYSLFDSDVRGHLDALAPVRPTDSGPAAALLGYSFIPPTAAAVAMGRSMLALKLL